jgi:putative hydrolase of the HAD superfamily
MVAVAGSQIEAVLLDAGGVLVMPDPAAFRKHLAPFGIAPSDKSCREAHYRGMAELDRIGRTDYPQADRVIARFLGISDGDIEAATAALHEIYAIEPFVAVPGVAGELLRLHQAGLRQAIVSNAEGTVEAQLADLGICARTGVDIAEVVTVVDSHLVGVEKPDPAIFVHALDALGLLPQQCVYLGDSVHFDVKGALAAGIAPIHVSPYGWCVESSHPHVPSLKAFTDEVLDRSVATRTAWGDR